MTSYRQGSIFNSEAATHTSYPVWDQCLLLGPPTTAGAGTALLEVHTVLGSYFGLLIVMTPARQCAK